MFVTGNALDEGILVFFRKPRSYTLEDMVELSLHGNPVILEEAVRFGVAAGARPARPGEFTLRACRNGRYDLIQAEAVNDLIRAESRLAAQLAWAQVQGGLSGKIGSLRQGVIELLADLEAAIEFPEDGLQMTKAAIIARIRRLSGEIERLVSSHAAGRAVAEGVSIAIVGRTNVGKSTLFNALLGEERAIVAPDPGTTRDYMKERLRIRDQGFTFIDMAGFSRPASTVEKEGVRRGKKQAEQADGLLILFDASRKARADDLALPASYRKRKTLLVFNKIDLPPRMDKDRIKKSFPKTPWIEISALKKTNIRKLLNKIHAVFSPLMPDSGEIIFHERQKLLLDSALIRLRAALTGLENGQSEEIAAEEVRAALPLIGRLTGEIGAEEVLGDIFDRFCVGK